MGNSSEKEITSLTSYLNYIESLQNEHSNKTSFFRGESSRYDYSLPGLFRNAGYVKNEKKLIQEMKSRIPKDIREIDYAIDRLALMQHHGLPTRVLDISTNALIALFFAVSGGEKEDGYVYVYSGKEYKLSSSDVISIKTALSQLSLEQQSTLDTFYKDSPDDTIVDFLNDPRNWKDDNVSDDPCDPKNDNLFNIVLHNKDINTIAEARTLFTNAIDSLYHQLKINVGDFSHRILKKDLYGADFVKPSQVDERIIKQYGAFLIVGLNGISRFEETLNYKGAEAKALKDIQKEIGGLTQDISKITIANDSKDNIKKELDNVGINESTVYPGMDEFSKYIKNMYEINTCPEEDA